MAETIENGQTLVYSGANGGSIPFSGAPSGRVYEASKNSPNITAEPQDVEWLLARGFTQEEGEMQSENTEPQNDIVAQQRQKIYELEQQLALAQSADPNKEYPNNAVLRVNPEDANTVRPDSDTDALREQVDHDNESTENESSEDQPASRRGRPRKSE